MNLIAPEAAPALRLISHELCPYVQRVRIALTEKNIAHERIFIDLGNKPAWFRRLSPTGKVPLLQVGLRVLFESAAISEYIEELSDSVALHPADPVDRAENRAWIEFGSGILSAIAGFYSAREESDFSERRDALREKFEQLENHLPAAFEGLYFNGRRFSLVDATYGPIFRYFPVIERKRAFGFFDGLPRLTAWRDAVMSRPSVRTAVVADYSEKLAAFLRRRESVISALI